MRENMKGFTEYSLSDKSVSSGWLTKGEQQIILMDYVVTHHIV